PAVEPVVSAVAGLPGPAPPNHVGAPRRQLLPDGFLTWSRRRYRIPPCHFRCAKPIGRLSSSRFSRDNENWPRVTAQIEGHHHGIEQVFPVVESALLLNGVFEVSIPGCFLPDLAVCVRETEIRTALIGREAYTSGLDLKRWIQRAVFMGCAVIVAECYERTQFECTG